MIWLSIAVDSFVCLFHLFLLFSYLINFCFETKQTTFKMYLNSIIFQMKWNEMKPIGCVAISNNYINSLFLFVNHFKPQTMWRKLITVSNGSHFIIATSLYRLHTILILLFRPSCVFCENQKQTTMPMRMDQARVFFLLFIWRMAAAGRINPYYLDTNCFLNRTKNHHSDKSDSNDILSSVTSVYARLSPMTQQWVFPFFFEQERKMNRFIYYHLMDEYMKCLRLQCTFVKQKDYRWSIGFIQYFLQTSIFKRYLLLHLFVANS